MSDTTVTPTLGNKSATLYQLKATLISRDKKIDALESNLTEAKNNTQTNLGKKINMPVDASGSVLNGTSGQILRSKGDGTTEWVDVIGASGIKPGNCTNIVGFYDKKLNHNKMKFKEPNDIVIDGNTICAIAGVKIVRNSSHIPKDLNDGETIDTIWRVSFHHYIDSYYVDTTMNPSEGETWYYKLIPFSSDGVCNVDDANAISIECRQYSLFGFVLNPNESNPSANITYIEDNDNFTSAHMNYETSTFDYGDWADAWFIAGLKPCRLKYDGTVAYELDPNNYALKKDGSPSDITDENADGNIMVGIPKVYYKIVKNNDNTITVTFSNRKIEEDYYCYAHMDANDKEIDYIYEPAYNGSLINNKLRSLSGKTIMNSKNGTDEIKFAKANNLENSNIWYTELLADINLINLLLILIGKSTETQATFGNGHYTGGSSASNLINPGTMDDKGLFWGTNGTGSGVKVFGIENYWGNQWRRVGGLIYKNGILQIKLTYNKSDGSTIVGYNTTGDGYITIEDSTFTGSSGGYINEMRPTKYGLFPVKASGSSSTFFCDGLWFNNEGTRYGLFGGSCYDSLQVGAFCCTLTSTVSNAYWTFGAAPSCKPLA